MADIVVRPTMKFIKAGYFLVTLLVVAGWIAWYSIDKKPEWVPAILLVLYLWPLQRQIGRRTSKLTITSDKLRYEVGLLGKSTRTIQLHKVQDVRVDQTFSQRLFGVGNISIETAGEASRLTVHHIDLPQRIADEIMARAQYNPAIEGPPHI